MKLKQFAQETGGGTGNRFQIDPRRLNVRPNFNLRDMTTQKARERLAILKAQIKAEGMLEPIEIEFDGEKPWINEGHRRHLVVMELIAEGEDIETVPVIQERQGTNDAKRILHMLMRGKEEYEPLEYAQGVHLLVNVHGKEKVDVARELGFASVNSIDQYLRMLAMPSEAQEMVKRDEVAATTAANQFRKEGAKAVETLKAAKVEANASGKTRVTQKHLTKVAGKSKPKINETFLDFVAVAGKFADEAKRAGGFDRISPDRLIELAKENAATLAKAKGEKPPGPPKEEAKPEPTPEIQAGESAVGPEAGASPAAGSDDGRDSRLPPQNSAADASEPAQATASSLSPYQPGLLRSLTDEEKAARATAFGDAKAREREEREWEAAAPTTRHRPASRVDELLLEFISVDCAALAAMHAKLNKEYDEHNAAQADDETSRSVHYHLIKIADHTGHALFPDEWEGAKGNSELAEVA